MLFSICNEKKKFYLGNIYYVLVVRMNDFCSICIGSLNYIKKSIMYFSFEILVILYVICNFYVIYLGVGYINKCLLYINFIYIFLW